MNGMKMGRADALCLAGMFLFLGVIIGMRIMF